MSDPQGGYQPIPPQPMGGYEQSAYPSIGYPVSSQTDYNNQQPPRHGRTITMRLWVFILCVAGDVVALTLIILLVIGMATAKTQTAVQQVTKPQTTHTATPSETIDSIARRCDVVVNTDGEIVYQYTTSGTDEEIKTGQCLLGEYPRKVDITTSQSGSVERNGVVYEWSVLSSNPDEAGGYYWPMLYIHEK